MKMIFKAFALVLFVKTALYCQPFYIDYNNRMGGPYVVDPYTHLVYHRSDVANYKVDVYNIPQRTKSLWEIDAAAPPTFLHKKHSAVYLPSGIDSLILYDFETGKKTPLARLPFIRKQLVPFGYYFSISPGDKYLLLQNEDSIYFLKDIKGSLLSRKFLYNNSDCPLTWINDTAFVFWAKLDNTSDVMGIIKYNIITDSYEIIARQPCYSLSASGAAITAYLPEEKELYYCIKDCYYDKVYVHKRNMITGTDTLINGSWPSSSFYGGVQDMYFSPDYSKLVFNSYAGNGFYQCIIYELQKEKVTPLFPMSGGNRTYQPTWYNNDTLLYTSAGLQYGFYGVSLPGILNGIDYPTNEKMSDYVLYPQPVYNNLTIKNRRPSGVNVNLRLMNVLGEELFALTIPTDERSDKITSEDLNKFLTKLSAGVYLLQIKESNANEVSVIKFVKLK